MKKRLLAIFCVSAVSFAAIGLVAHFASKDASSVFGDGPEDYALVLNSTTNVIHSTEFETKDSFHLSDETNTVDVLYKRYYQVDDAWGKLLDSGYFGLYRDEKTSERIGGLTSVHYSIDKDLVIEYGYQESGKPTYYSAPLPSGINTFNFPEGQGYPDTFKISNASGEEAIITAMTFYYTCNQTDQHVHVPTGEITRTTDDGVKYWNTCDICGAQSEVDMSAYKVEIGTSKDDLVEYNPYNYASYADSSRAGTLDFDYNETLETGTKRFVLTLSGDNSDKDIRINSNVGNSQIYVKSENNAKIHNIIFRGGYGVLLFVGDKLTFSEGTLDTEAMYTSVKSPLSFVHTGDRSGDALYLNNGHLSLESDVDISGYSRGIRVYQTATGTKDIEQAHGTTLTIQNCEDGIRSLNQEGTGNGPYSPLVFIKGEVRIAGVRHGIYSCSVQVGSDTEEGALFIDVDKTDTKGSDPAIAIDVMRSSANLNFLKGKAAIYSTNTAYDWTDAAWGEWGSGSPDTPNGSYTIGIRFQPKTIDDASRFQWSDTFKFALANLARGFHNLNGEDVTSFFGSTGIRNCDLHTFHLVDSAWCLTSKPDSGTNVTTHSDLSFIESF